MQKTEKNLKELKSVVKMRNGQIFSLDRLNAPSQTVSQGTDLVNILSEPNVKQYHGYSHQKRARYKKQANLLDVLNLGVPQ